MVSPAKPNEKSETEDYFVYLFFAAFIPATQDIHYDPHFFFLQIIERQLT